MPSRLRAARLRALSLLALLAHVGCRSGDAPWAQYEGHVVSDRSTDSLTARLTVAQTGDTAFSGYLSIDPRHPGTGDVWGWYPADSVHFVSVSTTGDTVFWRAERASRTMERLEGRYQITNGERAGEGGRWYATLERGFALRAGGPDLGLSRKSGGWIPWLVLWLGLVGLGLSARWTLQPASHVHVDPGPLTPAEAELQGIGGWITWFLFGQAFTIVWSIVLVPSHFGAFRDGTWELGDVIPWLRPILALEALFRFVQIAGPAFGLYLTLRRDPRAPRFWFVYLGAILVYSVVQLAGREYYEGELARAFGQSAADEVFGEGASGGRGAWGGIGAPIWMAYWSISRRVLFTFGRRALGAAVPTLAISFAPRAASPPARPSADRDESPPGSASADAAFRIPSPSSSAGRRDCPHCRGSVLAQANYCKHCHRDLEPLA